MEEGIIKQIQLIFQEQRLLVAFIFWILAWVFNAANNVILFKYDRSVFKSWHPWWQLNSDTEFGRRFGFLPPLRDGWHFTKWVQWALLFLGFGMWDIVLVVVFGFFAFIVFVLGFNSVFIK